MEVQIWWRVILRI